MTAAFCGPLPARKSNNPIARVILASELHRQHDSFSGDLGRANLPGVRAEWQPRCNLRVTDEG